jgi:pSer/pThr/pTyr-binding forkhead associated (FHA) protein
MDNAQSNPFMLANTGRQEDTGTRMESAEEIRAALQARRNPTTKEVVEEDTLDFRPVRRPSMVTLCILDDGRQEGEWKRLRGDETIIGRSEGDIVIPHDNEMSSRHLAITREADRDRIRWFLNDLNSTNGSFARISKAVLRQGHEILLGGKRYRFQAPSVANAAAASPGGRVVTRAFQSVQVDDLIPSLVEVTPMGDGPKMLLKQPENWIGRDANTCSIVLDNDMLVSPRHAKIYKDTKGVWQIENAGSRNGTWLRFTKLAVDSYSEFQVGEQRFLMKIML